MSTALLKRSVSQSSGNAFGVTQANDVAIHLIANGIEFHVEPMPDDAWMFTVKAEARAVLFRVIEATEKNHTWCRAHGRLDACPEHCPIGGGYFHGDAPCSHYPSYGCVQADGKRHGGS